jgi:hypothetical protein
MVRTVGRVRAPLSRRHTTLAVAHSLRNVFLGHVRPRSRLHEIGDKAMQRAVARERRGVAARAPRGQHVQVALERRG